MDIVDAATRSRMMAGIRGADTTPEIVVRRALHAMGFRFRIHDKRLPGRPDLVLPKWKAVVFVHGCFWHAHHGCRYFKVPATRTEFWVEKLSANADRDTRNLEKLRQLGWRRAVVWECALRADPAATIAELAQWLRSHGAGVELPKLTEG